MFPAKRSARLAPYFPVYQSTDGGRSWAYPSRVTDTVNGYGMRWNPQIYELPALAESDECSPRAFAACRS
jgi:hypothetical protein